MIKKYISKATLMGAALTALFGIASCTAGFEDANRPGSAASAGELARDNYTIGSFLVQMQNSVFPEQENDFQIFSFDHGYWFDSQEPPGRQLISFHQPAGRPEIPAIPGHIKKDNWQAAINAVDALEYSDLHHITDMIPPEWNQSKQGMDEILRYVLGRKDYTIERLTHHMNQTSR